MQEGGQHRVGSDRPPISSRIPGALPVGRALSKAPNVIDVIAAAAVHAASSRRVTRTIRTIGAVGVGVVIGYVTRHVIYVRRK